MIRTARPSTPAAAASSGAPVPEVRRARPRFRYLLGLLAVVALAGATSACTPEEVAKMAVQQYWGSNSACAEKVVQRESNFQSDAVNRSSGTTGLFQIHPVHAPWIKRTFGYEFADMKDPFKNSEVAKALSAEAYRMYKDGWQPWRSGGRRAPGGGCPA